MNRLIWDGHEPGEAVVKKLADMGRPVLLAFSCGKDAIAAWLALRAGGVEVIPYYMYLVPGLEFVERSLRYYEQFFGVPIIRVPNPSLYRLLNNFIFQPIHRCEIIRDCHLPNFTTDQLRDYLIQDKNLSPETWTASGVRAADSLARRANFRMLKGALNHKRRMAYPVWDMTKAGLVELLKSENVKLPIDYRIFGRSFDGIDFRFIAPLRKHFPNDYAKILEWFPFAELEMKRHEYSKAA